MNLIKYLKRKLKGSLLQMTLVIVLIITVSLSMFLVHRYYIKQFFLRYASVKQIHLDIESVNTIIESEEAVWPENPRTIRVSQITNINCNLSQWGFFSVIGFHTSSRNINSDYYRLYGRNIFKQFQFPSLYYGSDGKQISVGGDTYLSGDLFVPENGIQETTLEGKNYLRGKVHYGRVLRSENTIPEIHESNLSIIEMLSQNDFSTLIFNKSEVYQTNNVNSFSNPVMIFQLDGVNIFSNHSFNGNIWLEGGSELIIDGSTKVNDCILTADTIRLKQGFKGNGQFVARHKIILEDSVNISNPSVLCVWRPEGGGKILIGDNCNIYGDILIKSTTENKIPVLDVGESAICGQIYCHGMLQFQGVLFGNMYANYIVFLDHYFPVEHYLYSCCINAENIPEEYVGISFFNPYLNRRYAKSVF